MFSFEYLNDAPLLDVEGFPEPEGNINGPALIRAPSWLDNPPGRYLLYFAHHEGRAIRLAYSDRLTGPYRLHRPHPLQLEDSLFTPVPPAAEELDPRAQAFIDAGADGSYPHIASPDIWVDPAERSIRLYYHGRLANGLQKSRVALSRDGLAFNPLEPIVGEPYLRLMRHGDWYYALAMPARLSRSRDGLSGFEEGPQLTDAPIRHHAWLQFDDRCYLFWTRVGDQPERILVSEVEIDGDWRRWRLGQTREVHRAERAWEGGDLPADASAYGGIMRRANQLRDPAIFVEQERIYLLYAIAGEQGIAIGELRPIRPGCG